MRCLSAFPTMTYTNQFYEPQMRIRKNMRNIEYSSNQHLTEYPQLVFQRKNNTNFKEEKMFHYKNNIGNHFKTTNGIFNDNEIYENSANYNFIPKNQINNRLKSAKYPSMTKYKKHKKKNNIIDLELNYAPKIEKKVHNYDINTKKLFLKHKDNEIQKHKKLLTEQNLIHNEYNNYLKHIRLSNQKEKNEYTNFLIHFQDKDYLREIAKSIQTNKINTKTIKKKKIIIEPNLFIDQIIKNISRRIEFLGMSNNTITERDVMNLLEKEASKLNETIDKNMEAFCKIKQFSVILKNKAKKNNIKQNTYLIPFLNEILQPYYDEVSLKNLEDEELKSISNKTLKTTSTEMIVNKDKLFKIKTNLKPINENKMLSREISNDSFYDSSSYTSSPEFPIFGTIRKEDEKDDNEIEMNILRKKSMKRKRNKIKIKKSCINFIFHRCKLDKIDEIKYNNSTGKLLRKDNKKVFKKIIKNKILEDKKKEIEKKKELNDQLYRVIGKHKITSKELIHDLYSGGNTINNYKNLKYEKEKINNERDRIEEEKKYKELEEEEEKKLKEKEKEKEEKVKEKEKKEEKEKEKKEEKELNKIKINEIKDDFKNTNLNIQKKLTIDFRTEKTINRLKNKIENEISDKSSFEKEKKIKEEPIEKNVKFKEEKLKNKKEESSKKINKIIKQEIIKEITEEENKEQNDKNNMNKDSNPSENVFSNSNSEQFLEIINKDNELDKNSNSISDEPIIIESKNIESSKKRNSIIEEITESLSSNKRQMLKSKTLMYQKKELNDIEKKNSKIKNLDSILSESKKKLPVINNMFFDTKPKEKVVEIDPFKRLPKKQNTFKRKPTLRRMTTKKKTIKNNDIDLNVSSDFMEKLLKKQEEEEEKLKKENENKNEEPIIIKNEEKEEIKENENENENDEETIPSLNIKSKFFQSDKNKNKNKKVQIAPLEIEIEKEPIENKSKFHYLKRKTTTDETNINSNIGEKGNIDNHEYEKISNLLSDRSQSKKSFKRLKTRTNNEYEESGNNTPRNISENDFVDFSEENEISEIDTEVKKKKKKSNLEKFIDEINRLKTMSIEEYIEFLDKQYNEKVDEFQDYMIKQKEEERINKFVYSLINDMDKREFSRQLKSSHCQPVNYVDTLGNKLENI